jgi:hypothetical protein
MTPIRSFSYGGGVQSTAALVLAANGEIDFPLFCFANVGDDDEHPATLEYVREVAMPYARMKGIEILELQRVLQRTGEKDSLSAKIERSKSIPIPMRMGPRAAPASRTCTADFKIAVVERELRRRGATKESKAIVGIGISLDELERAGSAVDPKSEYQLREYPLIDLELTRDQCQEIIRREGLPVPPPSSCFFCPFHRDHEWMRMAREEPELFEKACKLEERLHERGKALGGGDFYMTRHGDFLRNLFHGNQLTMFEDDRLGLSEATCDTGYCMI